MASLVLEALPDLYFKDSWWDRHQGRATLDGADVDEPYGWHAIGHDGGPDTFALVLNDMERCELWLAEAMRTGAPPFFDFREVDGGPALGRVILASFRPA